MDPFPSTWSSQLDLDDPALIHHLQMESSIDDQPMNYFSFSSPVISTSEVYQTTMIQPPTPPSTLTFCTSTPKETSKILPFSSPPLSSQFISFGNSNSPKFSAYQHNGLPMFTVKTEAETDRMMYFESMDFSPSSLQELYHEFGAIGYGSQPIKRGGSATRTALQAKSHVISERKRREKLAQRFMSLSALVPGLKKMDKTSVIDGAINHLKQLEKRLKTLEEETKMKRDGELILDAHEKPHLCYYYEEDSCPSVKKSKTSIDQSSKKMEVRILKGDVLIRVTCKRQTGFREGFLSEMKRLNLSVTNSKFIPFADNMLAVSAVAQMNEGFCMTEEELANSIRLAILKLV